MASTNSCVYFHVQEFFSEFVYFHELPSTLYNQNLHRADKLHVTTKGNDILIRWFPHCPPTSTPTNPEPINPSCTTLQDVPFPLVITDTDWPPLPAPSHSSNPAMPSRCRYSNVVRLSLHVTLSVPSQFLIPFQY